MKPSLSQWRRGWALCAALLMQPAAADGLPARVTEALKQAGLPAEALSLQVVPAAGGRALLSHRADVAMNPASVMKLLTTYAALDRLGPAYTWRTELLSDAAPRDGRLDAPLYLRGSGDPKLTVEAFWLLLRQLRARGIHTLGGDLVLDRGRFEIAAQSAGQFDGEALEPYNVQPDALLVGFKSLRLKLEPDAATGRVRVYPELLPAGLGVDADIRLYEGECGDWKDELKATPGGTAGAWRLHVVGRYASGCAVRVWNQSPLNHAEFVGAVFRLLWAELGGRFEGRVIEAATPAGAQTLAMRESATLGELVRDINKFSNNVMARQLYLTLGAEAGTRPAGAAHAEAAVRTWLAERALELPSLVLDNGSGLSRSERLSAADTARLLQHAWISPWMPEFVASLPLAGIDGTVRNRLKNGPATGRARLKTGSLDAVKTLAGYVPDRHGRMLAVVAFVNHAQARGAQAALDAVVQWAASR